MKLVVFLALVVIATADVSHVNQNYLPPNQDYLPPLAAPPLADSVAPGPVGPEPVVERFAEEPLFNGMPGHREAVPAHTLDADGYKYKSPF